MRAACVQMCSGEDVSANLAVAGAVKKDVAFLGSSNFVFLLTLFRFLRIQRNDLWPSPIAAAA